VPGCPLLDRLKAEEEDERYLTVTPLPDGQGIALEGRPAYGKILEGIVLVSPAVPAVQHKWRPVVFVHKYVDVIFE
jgi:hypothetical protein